MSLPLQTVDQSPLNLRRFWAAARQVHPGPTLRAAKHRLVFLFACLKSWPQLREMFDRIDHRALKQELQRRPETLGFVVWPYISADWAIRQRFEKIAQHRQALLDDMTVLDIDLSDAIVVADLSDVSPGLRLVVDRAPWFVREGGLVLNEFQHDERMMSLAFSFGELDGVRVVYVGCIQGSHDHSALLTYRKITKNLEGMRSRDFLIKCFQFLMCHLGVQRILCVPDEQRHHRHAYFKKDKAIDLHLHYDQIWREHAGRLSTDGFYELSLAPIIKPTKEISSKKRAMYRRRYQLLAEIDTRIASCLKTVAHPCQQGFTNSKTGNSP